MLKRIKIQGYKSLIDLEVHLNPLSFLFGPNAAGKSNFLDALHLLSRIATSRTLKDAFEPPYRGKPLESFTFDDNGIKGLLGQETASFSIEVDVELSSKVIDTSNRQIREIKKSNPTDGIVEPEAKTQSFVREPNLRYRIEREVLPT